MVLSCVADDRGGAAGFGVCSDGFWYCLGLVIPCYVSIFPFETGMFILFHCVLEHAMCFYLCLIYLFL